MQEFLTNNPILAVIFMVMIAVILIVIAVKAMQTLGMEEIRGYIYSLFLEAEHDYKYGENKQKFEYVVQLARSALPSPFNLVITEKFLRKTIQLWFNLVKDMLDDGKLNSSGEEGEQ